ncbi:MULTISPECIES: restriction endonuclease subunit S [unclassified Moraxella]|uniref:restriction endonuclease subunit S n=1 Tax=unclassified Moraxella TaxID=2685852 RepID=UPI002B407422|nr:MULTISPECIES: restriction endonuclease subunit S [unclassified Moraxella]
METLKFVNFKQLDKWYVSYYTNPHKIQSLFNLIKLSEVLYPKKQKIAKKDYDNQTDVVAKISFNDGKIHIRPERKTGMDLYFVPKNSLLISKINFHQGALAINNIGDLVCSTHYQPYEIINEDINTDYLIMALRASKFQEYLSFLRADGIKNEATFDFIKQLEIPLPDIDIQKSLVSAYQEKIKQAEILENQAKQIDDEIEQYLFDSLGVQIEQSVSQQKQDILQFVAFKELEKWSVKDTNNITAETVFLSKKYSNEPITNYFLVNPSTSIPKDKDISFIPMANISDEYGEIMSKEINKLQNNYTRFQENDLLWAKITPCMQNGKSAIANDLLNGFGFGSTEFHILRIKNSGFDIRLLHLLLRSKRLLTTAMTYFTGSAGQQRVPKSFLESLTLPIISNDEQIAIINHIYNIKNAQKQAKTQAKILREQAIEEFEKAVFE